MHLLTLSQLKTVKTLKRLFRLNANLDSEGRPYRHPEPVAEAKSVGLRRGYSGGVPGRPYLE